jgi:hypothetical protein
MANVGQAKKECKISKDPRGHAEELIYGDSVISLPANVQCCRFSGDSLCEFQRSKARCVLRGLSRHATAANKTQRRPQVVP